MADVSDQGTRFEGERWTIYREPGKAWEVASLWDADTNLAELGYEAVEVVPASALTQSEERERELQRRVWSIEDAVIGPYNAELETQLSSHREALRELVEAALKAKEADGYGTSYTLWRSRIEELWNRAEQADALLSDQPKEEQW